MRKSTKEILDAWLDRDEATWGARLVAAGSLLTLLYELTFIVLDRRFLSTDHPLVVLLHGVSIGLYAVAVVLVLNVGPWLRGHWKPIAFAFSSGMIGCSAVICVF